MTSGPAAPVPAQRGPLARRLADWLDAEAARLFPGYFALVMATGIISNTLYLEKYRGLSDLLVMIGGGKAAHGEIEFGRKNEDEQGLAQT